MLLETPRNKPFNNYDLEKGIYDAKRQALETGKGLTRQLVGQERMEALMAAPAIGKTAYGLGKTALKAAANPSEFASGAKAQAYEGLKSQFKSITGRDLPGSLEEARAGVEAEARGVAEGAVSTARGTVEGALGQARGAATDALGQARGVAEGAVSTAREAGDRAVQTAQSAGRSAEQVATGTAERFRSTVDSQIPETGIERSALQQGANPFFGQGGAARRVAEPGDVEYAAQQGARRALEAPDMPVGEVPSVGGFPREGLPAPRGSVGDPTPVTESANRANILRQAEQSRPQAEQTEPIPDAPRLSSRPFDNEDLPDIEPMKTTEQRIQDVRQGLRPTETRVAEPDLAEAQRLGARPIARSVARQPLSAEEAQRAGYKPPSTPRPERPGRIPEEPGPTEGPGGYTRPGTDLRIPATREAVPQFRGEAPSAVAEREESEAADQALAERGSVADLFGQAERGGARAARTVRETATDDTEGLSTRVEEPLTFPEPPTTTARPTPSADELVNRYSGNEDLVSTEDRIARLDLEGGGTGKEAQEAELEARAQRTGGEVPSTARGEETSRLGPEPEGRPGLAPERATATEAEPASAEQPYSNPALNDRFGSARPEQPDLPEIPEHTVDEYGLPKEPNPVAPEASEAGAEASAAKVGDEAAETALKTGGEEIAAEAPLDAVPGLGELVMAGTLLGSLFHAHHEEKEAEARTAGPPPKPAADSTPTMAFDSAPTLDTSSYHSL